MNPIKITCVSYLNTIPFVFGIKNSGLLSNYELSLDYPRICAEKLLTNKTDIALVPVAALRNIHDLSIYTNYCIGSDGDVKTVLLLSKVPIHKITQIYLDSHSVTSVNLVKILAKKLWFISPEWIPSDNTLTPLYSDIESLVAIGDKTFNLSKKYPFSYDLGAAWKELTGLPFVFACWAGKNDLPETFINQLNMALGWGITHQKEAVRRIKHSSIITTYEAEKYLSENISFCMDDLKHKAIDLFNKYLTEMFN